MSAAPAALLVDDHGQPFTSLEAFLRHAKLESYAAALAEVGIDDVGDVLEVTGEDLRALGMTKEFHIRRFLRHVKQCSVGAAPDAKPKRSTWGPSSGVAQEGPGAGPLLRAVSEPPTSPAAPLGQPTTLAELASQLADLKTKMEAKDQEVEELRRELTLNSSSSSSSSLLEGLRRELTLNGSGSLVDDLRRMLTPSSSLNSSGSLLSPDTSVASLSAAPETFLFISHSRRDGGALNAARMFASALRGSKDASGAPYSSACFQDEAEGIVPKILLWFDKEEMQSMGGAGWADELADAQADALATVCFLSNAYLGSGECMKELTFADELVKEENKCLIPVFLESFVNCSEDFEVQGIKNHCDKNLKSWKAWNKKRQLARKTAGCLQGVPAFFDNLRSEFTCAECRAKKDHVCLSTIAGPGCSTLQKARSTAQWPQVETALKQLGQYVDHLADSELKRRRSAGIPTSSSSPQLVVTRGGASAAAAASPWIEPGDAIAVQTRDRSQSSPLSPISERQRSTPSSALRTDSRAGPLSSMDFTSQDLTTAFGQMHPSLTFYLQDSCDEHSKFRDPSGEEVNTTEQSISLKYGRISSWQQGRQKARAYVDGAEEVLIARRWGYGASIGYGDDQTPAAQVPSASIFVEAEDLLIRKHSVRSDAVRGRAVVVLGAAASGKTTMLKQLFVTGAQRALRAAEDGSLVDQAVPYFVRVSELAKWLNTRAQDSGSGGDLPLSTLEHYISDAHGGASSPLSQQLVHYLGKNQLTLLFDGLDEAGDQLQRISRLIGWQLRSNTNCSIVVTSRESLFGGVSAECFHKSFELVQVQPLTRQMQLDIVQRRFRDEAEGNMGKFLEQQQLGQMSENPMLLTLQIGVFKKNGELPKKRSQIYDAAIRQLIRTRAEETEVDKIANFLTELGHVVHMILQKRDFTEDEVSRELQIRGSYFPSSVHVLRTRAQKQGIGASDLNGLNEDKIIAILTQRYLSTHDGSSKTELDQGVESLLAELEDLQEDGAWAKACATGLLMVVDHEKKVYRFNHLSFQEFLAASQCVKNLNTEDSIVSTFGSELDPWRREVLLMTAEQLDDGRFEALADYFLSLDAEGTGASAVLIHSMLRSRKEPLDSGVGARIIQKLSQTRSCAFMSMALQHPCELLCDLVLTEIDAYRMPRDEIVQSLLQALVQQPDSGTRPFYVEVQTIRSIAKLKVSSTEVMQCFVDIALRTDALTADGRQQTVVREAISALGNVDQCQDNDHVVRYVLAELDKSAADADTRHATLVWQRLINPLQISDERVLVQLRKLCDVMLFGATDTGAIRRFASIETVVEEAVPPEASTLSTPIQYQFARSKPQLTPEPEREPGPDIETQSHTLTRNASINYVTKAQTAICELLREAPGSQVTDSEMVNQVMSALQDILPSVGVMQHLCKEVEPISTVFIEFVLGKSDTSQPGRNWWSSLGLIPTEDAASTTGWFCFEMAARILTAEHGVSLSKQDQVKAELLSRRFIQAFESNIDSLGFHHSRHGQHAVELLFDDRSAQDGKQIAHARLERLLSSPMKQFAFCPLLQYLRCQLKELSLQQAGTGRQQLTRAFSESLEPYLSALPDVEAVFIRKELSIGRDEVERPYWSPKFNIDIMPADDEPSAMASEALASAAGRSAASRTITVRDGRKYAVGQDGTFRGPDGNTLTGQVLLVEPFPHASAPNRSKVVFVPSSVTAAQATLPPEPHMDVPDSPALGDQQGIVSRFLEVTGFQMEEQEAVQFLRERGWDSRRAVQDFFVRIDHEKAVAAAVTMPEGLPPSNADLWSEATPHQRVQNVTACTEAEARKALDEVGGNVDLAVSNILGGTGGGAAAGFSQHSPSNTTSSSRRHRSMSTFVLEFRAGYRSGKFSVANNARTIEEFETPSNIEGVKRSFSRELGCRADEVELTILADECELNPHAEGLDAMRTAEQSGHYRDFRIRWRKREYGVWGEWQSSTIASTARRVSDYTERQIQRLRRMYAEEMGVADLENVEVIVDSVVEPDARDQFITLPQL